MEYGDKLVARLVASVTILGKLLIGHSLYKRIFLSNHAVGFIMRWVINSAYNLDNSYLTKVDTREDL